MGDEGKMKKIKLKDLEKIEEFKICKEQKEKFKEKFTDGNKCEVEITEENVLLHHKDFVIGWMADHLLPKNLAEEFHRRNNENLETYFDLTGDLSTRNEKKPFHDDYMEKQALLFYELYNRGND
jgi:hypothetical protein